jgi:transposase
MTRKGFETFEADIERFDNPCFGLESTGGYHLNLLSFLLSRTEHVYLTNPLLIKRFSQAVSLRKTKTDLIDANHNAQVLRQNVTQLSPFLTEDIQALSTLARLRESIVQQIAQTKTHLKQQLNTAFPELEKHCLLFTNTRVAVLEQCPSAQAFKDIRETQLQKILTQQAKAVGCDARISAKQLKDLAQHSIGKVDPLLEEVIRFDIAHLQFLMTKEKDITRKLTEQIEKTNYSGACVANTQSSYNANWKSSLP